MKNNDDKPQFDGDFLCLVSTPQQCGSVITRWRVVTLDNNAWLISPGETVNEWHPLPRIDENGKVAVGEIKAFPDSAWIDPGSPLINVSYSQKLHGVLRNFHIQIDTESAIGEKIINNLRADNPGFFTILIY